jgi:uncharacterized protein (DUF608 family)
MNYAFITKSKKWLPIFLPLVPKRREALWWSRKRYANQHKLKNQFAKNWKWNEVLWLNGKLNRLESLYKTHLTTSLFLDCCSQDWFLQIPSLGLNSLISSHKNKNAIRSVLENKWKKNYKLGPIGCPLN